VAERTKGFGRQRMGPVTRFFDTSKLTPGDQFHLLSQLNSDEQSDLISSRTTDLALRESETLMVQLGGSDGYDNAKGTDRYRQRIWLIALVAVAIPIPWVIFQILTDATGRQIVVSRQIAAQAAPVVARQSGETLLASAEQKRPRDDPTNGLNSGLTLDDTAADTKSVGQGQSAPPQALATTQSPARPIDKEELANALTPDDTKSVGQGQNAPPRALAATQSPARLIDREELASLLKRGRYLFSIGDIAPARLLLERAADAHEASAAFDLAGTYDPAVLTRSHVLGIAPDLAMARMWYEKALSLGHSEAQQRLAQLQK
jgi:hypothetical protein